jgi:hypothetical protein
VVGVIVRSRNKFDGREGGLVVGTIALVIVVHGTTIALEVGLKHKETSINAASSHIAASSTHQLG